MRSSQQMKGQLEKKKNCIALLPASSVSVDCFFYILCNQRKSIILTETNYHSKQTYLLAYTKSTHRTLGLQMLVKLQGSTVLRQIKMQTTN